MKKRLYIFAILALFIACHDDDSNIIKDTPENTVIVYMVADNNLNDNGYDNINQMESAFTDNNLNLIVYFDPQDDIPRLLKIQKDKTDEINSIVIKEYEEQNSADPKTMNCVLNDAKNRFSAKSMGLILWSHADAWIPPTKAKTRSIFEDKGIEMDIKDFSASVPNGFDYCIFDACWLGSIEFLYELRNKTPYVLASPIEILADGMPYNKVVPLLFKNTAPKDKLTAIGKAYFEYYNSKSESYETASISLIKTDEIDKLTSLTKELLTKNPLPLWDYNINSVQKLYNKNYRPLYDFLDFLERNYGSSETAAIKTQLSKTVLYEAHTDYYFSTIALNNLCGLSCYIPNEYGRHNDYYQTLSWTKASGFDTLFE